MHLIITKTRFVFQVGRWGFSAYRIPGGWRKEWTYPAKTRAAIARSDEFRKSREQFAKEAIEASMARAKGA